MQQTREILQVGDPRLRRAARPVGHTELAGPEIQNLIDDLIATMRDANGAGLAATQVGAELRICVIEVDQNLRYPYKPRIPLTVLVNPVITALTDEMFANNEGCLSVPGIRGTVDRFTEIAVAAIDRTGARLELTVRGLSAGTFQHECDHLDGLLFLDRVTDPGTLTTWENFERFHRSTYIERVTALVDRYGQ